MNINVCYVVNSVSETSVPATIATALVDYENISVDILAWFNAEPFEGDDRVGVTCLQAPSTTLGIGSPTLTEARNHLHNYDVVQTHHNHSGSFARLIGHTLDTPMVSREGNVRQGFTRKGRIANGLTNPLVDCVVPNSRAVYESFTWWERQLLNNNQIRIIPNGVDLERLDRATGSDYSIRDEFAIPTDSIVVGTASAIIEQKGIGTLIRAIDTANDSTEQRLDLVIAGDGPLRKRMEQLTSRLGISEFIHFAGMVERNHVYRLLGEFDIYAMPSRWEGFANAAVEALGAGNPCVFSDIDPFLYPYKNVAQFHTVDDDEELARILSELAQHPDQRDFYSRRGRELVEKKYRLEHIASQYAELYRDIVQQR